MAYDLEGSVSRIHRMATEDKEKREREEIDKGFNAPQSSMPKMGSQEYIDNCDIPGVMDDGLALLLYIIVMVVGIIFKDRWLIWSGATIVYLCHVFRRQLYKAKWEREHKNK